MDIRKHPLVDRLLSHGWIANVVILVLGAAVVQWSLLGVVLALAAIVVLELTTSRSPEDRAKTASSRSATWLGLALAVLLSLSASYVAVRPSLKTELPSQVIDVMVSQAQADQSEKILIDSIPQFQVSRKTEPIFGYEKLSKYEVVAATSLAASLFGRGLWLIDWILVTTVGTVVFWFLFALVCRRLAEDTGLDGD